MQQGMSLATGVARTSELTLFATDRVPTKEATATMAQTGAAPPVIVCTPQALHDAEAFGVWGLEDRSTATRRAIEDRLAATLNYYLTQPEQRRWYGFWDFGDVMHSYDNDRHVWRYDLGGMAWDNSELGTDMWIWYSYLHTGRADVFRMAEAMAADRRGVGVPSRTLRGAGLPPRCAPLGRRRQGGPHQPGRLSPLLLLSDDRRAHR